MKTTPNEYTNTGPASPTRQPILSRGRARIPDSSFPREGSRSPASSYRSRRHRPLTPTNQDVGHWNTPAQGPESLYHPITAGLPPLSDVYVHPRPRLRSSAGRLGGVRQEQRERSRVSLLYYCYHTLCVPHTYSRSRRHSLQVTHWVLCHLIPPFQLSQAAMIRLCPAQRLR